MYAIIRTGGKQTKVREGDVIDVERLRAEGEITFTPLLFVGDDGTVISDRDGLKDVRVVGRILGGAAGPKVDIFKYKAKTGYRRRQGHRQKYTTVEVTAIEAPGVSRADEAPEPEKADEPAAEPTNAATATPAEKTSAPKTTAAKTTTAKSGAAKPAAAKKTAAKPSSAKGGGSSSTATTKKAPAKKPAPKKEG